MLNLDDFYRARYVLSNVVRRTDLIYAPKINQESEIYLKPENLQVTGSFKLRGACYKISQLGDEEKAKGVIACSAGNHAQGVALGAAKYGIKSLICLPGRGTDQQGGGHTSVGSRHLFGTRRIR